MKPWATKPVSLIAEGNDQYRVQFECADSVREYVFTCDTSNNIPIVSSEHRFLVDSEHEPPTSLLKAIMAFHEARQSQ